MNTNKVNPQVIASNRCNLSTIGKQFGCQYYRPEARQNTLNFEELKRDIEMNGNKDLILNRSIQRFRVLGYDVQSLQIGEDISGAPVVIINKDLPSSVVMPISPDLSYVGKVTDDAIGKALRGDNSIIFSDVKALVSAANVANNSELTRIDNLIEDLKKDKQAILAAIDENNKKVEAYVREFGEPNVTVTIKEG